MTSLLCYFLYRIVIYSMYNIIFIRKNIKKNVLYKKMDLVYTKSIKHNYFSNELKNIEIRLRTPHRMGICCIVI